MSWLAAFNFVLLQWVGFRLARMCEEDGRQVAWALLGPVLPLTGWFGLGYVGFPRTRFLREAS